MDHPLVSQEQKHLRQRVVQLLRTSYNVRRSSNIVFVCGGNDDAHMRMLFRAYCVNNLPDFEIFHPEYAMENIFSIEPDEPFDITDFEQLISELSHAIVIFPEGAGSFAETGYFSAIKQIAKRCILVLNSKYIKDSFISLGPAKKISESSIFHPLVKIDYDNPNFDEISERIRRINKYVYKKNLSFEEFKDLSPFELSCIIHEIVNILTIATIDDVLFTFKLIFKNRHSAPKVRKLVSILIGAKYLRHLGDYGHMSINPNKTKLLELREGYVEEERSIRLSLAEIYQDSDADFLTLVEASRDVN